MISDQQDRFGFFERDKFTQFEIDIYNGLKLLSDHIANLFADGVRVKNDKQLISKTQLLGHLAREIDSSIRNILAPSSLEKKINKKLSGFSIEQELKDRTKHISSIIASFGDDPNIMKEELTSRWINIATGFHKLAHKRGVENKIEEQQEILQIWDDYERILYQLFGNQLNLLSRIDRILKIPEPHKELLGTIPNILQDNSIEFYFFKNLTYLTWLIPLNAIGYFATEHIYRGSPSIIDYLIRMAKENFKRENEKITYVLLNVVDRCVDYRTLKIPDENPYIVDAAILELCSHLPIEKIPGKVIKILEYSVKAEPNFSFVIMSSMDNFIPYLIKNKNDELYEEFIRVILDYDVKDRTYPDYEAKINDSQLFDLLRKAKNRIIENYSEITLKVVIEIINKILISDPVAFNYWQVATIEDSSQLSFHDRYQVQLIQLVSEILIVYDRDKCEKILREWLKSEHTIYRRIAIFLINKRYAEFKHLFWKLEGNPIDDDDCLHELYQLFSEHSKEFDVDEVSKILDWIEKTDYYVSDDKIEEQRDTVIAFRKRGWLSALSASENELVIQKIIEYEKVNDTPLDHPGHIIWHETTYGFKSPINIHDFKESTVDEIVDALKKIKYANDSEALDNRGINIQLADLVKNDPMKFSNEIKKFDELSISFKSDAINGLTNAWKAGKQFNWESTLDFVLDVIKEDSFWQKDYKGGYDFRNSFIRHVCEVLTAGTQNDNNAFDEKYLDKAEEILLIIDQKIRDSGDGFNDAATHYLNSTFGKFYDALLNLSLRYARIHKETKQDLWLPRIKQIFNRRLDRKSEPSIDISVCLGGFLPNFKFLDQQWVIDNINLIFPKKDGLHWQAAFEGYLSFVRNYYKDIYILFRNNNHILKAINSDFERQIAENLFAHIFLAHLSGLESLDDPESMLSKIIESEKYNSTIAHFLWTQRDNPDVTSEIIFPIWKNIFDQIKANLKDEENKRIISDLTQLLCYFETIPDDLFDILSFSAKYLKSGFGTVHFVEELNRLRKIELDRVGKLFLKLLDNDDYPTYKTEHIIEIIEELYTNGYKNLANNICNRYAKKNILFLRGLYEKYNKNRN